MLVFNVWLVKAIGIPGGYMGSAWAALISYFTVMVISYFLGRKYYPINYHLKRMGVYFIFAAVLYGAGLLADSFFTVGIAYVVKTLLLAIYGGAVVMIEKPHRRSPADR